MDEYRKAGVCLNGHPTTGDVEHSGEHTSQYCSECGEKTIRVCSSCKKSIRGSCYMDPEGYGFEPIQVRPYTKAPAYCHACGNAYPWTQTALDSAKELVEELDQLAACRTFDVSPLFSELLSRVVFRRLNQAAA